MAQRVAWGQRRALGRRYSVDPAYELASEEQAQQLALASQRDARALQASQFNEQMQFNREQADQNRKSSTQAGITGTVGNLATTAALGYFMKGGGTQPTPALGGSSQMTASGAGITGYGGGTSTPVFTEGMMQTASPSVSPALTDTTLATAEGAGSVGSAGGASSFAGSTAGEAQAASVGLQGAGSGATAGGATLGGAGSAAMSAAPYAALGYLGAKYGGQMLERWAGGPESSNAFAKTGRTMQTPFEGIGRPWLREMGKLNKTTDTVMKVMNPIQVVVEWFDDWF